MQSTSDFIQKFYKLWFEKEKNMNKFIKTPPFSETGVVDLLSDPPAGPMSGPPIQNISV